jgi:uncharacterized membrane protein
LNHKDHNAGTPAKASRIAAIDIARGLALLAMAIYHFAWDLEFFGYAEPGTTLKPEWKYFARAIASSFLMLVGVSLVLGHQHALKLRSFTIRLGKVALAAGLISLVTWFAIPGGFIFFGILHSIALGSLLALAFLNLPWLVNLAAAIFFVSAPLYLKSDLLSAPIWYWLGLSPTPPVSNDYVPIFPWFGLILLGVAMAQLVAAKGFFQLLARWKPDSKLSRSLTFFSKHSLLTYLIHQPLLLGLIYVFVAITGGPDRTPAFINSCETNCSTTRDGKFCKKFCACVVSDLKIQKLWDPIHNRQININSDPQVKSITKSCSIQSQ